MRRILGRLAPLPSAAVVLGMSLAGAAVPVHTETVNCTDVATLAVAPPYTISAEGVYCLKADIAFAGTSGAAITIESNNVVLDLNGHKIGGGPAGPATLASGVFVNNHGNVIVKNGLVRGFFSGITYAPGTANNGNIVEDILAVANTSFGIYMGGPGTNNTVRNCIVGTTGGSTAVTGISAGIYNAATSSFVTHNTVNNTFPTSGGTVRFGIFMSTDGRAVDNQILGDAGTTGTNVCILMASGTLYKDNVVSRCITSYSGGTPVGTTNFP
jgi:hypothetical protein